MKLLNIGCGATFHPSWTNIDFEPSSPMVQKYDIRKGLPFPAESFDVCYSSHLLEHLNSKEAVTFMKEIYRVLNPEGIVRIIVPDLECITRTYLALLDRLVSGDLGSEKDYDWIMLELYDQAVRDISGGNMGSYLTDVAAENREFILSRIGFEANKIWDIESRTDNRSLLEKIRSKRFMWYVNRLRIQIASILLRVVVGSDAVHAFKEGLFRKSGEVHRWMYDHYSLKRLMGLAGFVDINTCAADESRITDFNSYHLDVVDCKVRKPDSLFMEGIKS